MKEYEIIENENLEDIFIISRDYSIDQPNIWLVNGYSTTTQKYLKRPTKETFKIIQQCLLLYEAFFISQPQYKIKYPK